MTDADNSTDSDNDNDRAIMRTISKIPSITSTLTGQWMSPCIMQSIDTRIVHRSNSLSGWQYGRNLIYREAQASSGYFSALTASAIGSLVGLLLFFSPSRNVIKSYLPKQGEGPSQDLLDNGFVNIGFWGVGRDARGKEVVVKGKVSATGGDPGYRYVRKYEGIIGLYYLILLYFCD